MIDVIVRLMLKKISGTLFQPSFDVIVPSSCTGHRHDTALHLCDFAGMGVILYTIRGSHAERAIPRQVNSYGSYFCVYNGEPAAFTQKAAFALRVLSFEPFESAASMCKESSQPWARIDGGFNDSLFRALRVAHPGDCESVETSHTDDFAVCVLRRVLDPGRMT
jgi:hypothetical protein